MLDWTPYPLKLVPRFLAKPWGGRRMEAVLGRKLPDDGPIGESWEVFDRDGMSSTIANGPLAGHTLADVRGNEPFPLLVKLLDVSTPLSIQVHPDDEAAAELGGEPKSECWFVLQADQGAKVYRGLADGVDEAQVRRAIEGGTVAHLLHPIEVKPGDVLFLPAGTVHAIDGGVLLAEVQQNSDTTFRFDDWGRVGLDGKPRELHLDQALRSIRYGPRSEDLVPTQVIDDNGRITRLLLVKSRFFSVEHVTAMGTFTLDVDPTDGCPFSVLHVLGGEGELRPFHRGVDPVPFRPGDTILLPAEFDAYEVSPGASVVRFMLFRR